MTPTDPQLSESPTEATSESFPEVVLTLAEAAWAAGLTREELEHGIRSGELKVRRIVRAGRLVSVVAMKELERVYRSVSSGREEAEREDQRLREQVARLEGQLDTSERVERSLQRYTDRLEERFAVRVRELENTLAISRQRELTLARALGRIEGQYASSREQLGEGSDELSDDGPLVRESVAR